MLSKSRNKLVYFLWYTIKLNSLWNTKNLLFNNGKMTFQKWTFHLGCFRHEKQNHKIFIVQHFQHFHRYTVIIFYSIILKICHWSIKKITSYYHLSEQLLADSWNLYVVCTKMDNENVPTVNIKAAVDLLHNHILIKKTSWQKWLYNSC